MLLGVWLVLTGVSPFLRVDGAGSSAVLSGLAILVGTLILLGR